MLQWIQNWLQAVWDTIVSLLSFVAGIFKSMFDIIKLLPTVVSLVIDSIGFLPSVVSLFAIISVSLSIAYLIAGRNTN